MEINGRDPNLNGNGNGNHSSGDLKVSINGKSNETTTFGDSKVSINGKSNETTTFVNHAEIAWHERRREWVGDQSENARRAPMEPILSWTTTYEDLLLTSERFQQPIPLAEMVDFLVDIWYEDGLYD